MRKRQSMSGKWAGTLTFIVALHLFLDFYYRPWAIHYNISDFGFASSFTQLTSIVGITCIMLLIERRKPASSALPDIFFAIIPPIAMLLYEFLQLLLPATFDWIDVLYCLFGGGLNYLLLKYWLLK